MKETFKLSKQTSIHDPMVLNSTEMYALQQITLLHTHFIPLSITDSCG